MDPWVDQSPWAFVDHLRASVSDEPVFGEGEPALWEACDAPISAVVLDLMESLEGHGAMRVDCPLPEAVDAQELLRIGNVVSAELAELLQSEMPEWLDCLDPLVGARIRDGGSISASEWLARRRRLERISTTAADRFESCDVMICPTVTITPPRLDEVSDLTGYRAANMASLHNTCVANSLSLCAIIPARRTG
jgi:aspartyl-tRNA(Asn)/glutamyl-tRNA(Gln) amidotransferase subunit A